MENHCVYTVVQNSLIANALIDGDGDCVIRGITPATCAEYSLVVNRDWCKMNTWSIDSTNKFTRMDPANISDRWRAQQETIRMRQDLMFTWYSHVEASLSRVIRHAWEHFDVVMKAELAKCDPANNAYTWIIEEYARTLGQPVNQVYKEVKLRIESDDNVRFRIQAMAEKWKNIINRASTYDQSEQIRRDMSREFWRNSQI
jgi:hypothetical protein